MKKMDTDWLIPSLTVISWISKALLTQSLKQNMQLWPISNQKIPCKYACVSCAFLICQLCDELMTLGIFKPP